MMGEYVFKRKWLRLLAGILDFFGYCLKTIFNLFSKQQVLKSPDEYRKILLIRLDHMGDGLFLLPTLQSARKLFPNAHLTLLAGPWASSFVKPGVWVDEVKIFEAPWFRRPPQFFRWTHFWEINRWIKKQGFEIGIDFRGDLRHLLWMSLCCIPIRAGYGGTGAGFLLTHEKSLNSTHHEVERNLDLLRLFQPGLKAGPFEAPTVYENAKIKIGELLTTNGVQGDMGLAIFQVTAGYPSKEWEPAKFAEVMSKVSENPKLLVGVIGAREDADRIEKILTLVKSPVLNLCGKTNLEELGALFQRASVYVGLDSGPAHLAVAMGTRCVLIYSGVNDLRRWGPWIMGKEEKVQILHREVSCSPCTLSVCNRKHECLEPIQPGDVIKALAPWLGG